VVPAPSRVSIVGATVPWTFAPAPPATSEPLPAVPSAWAILSASGAPAPSTLWEASTLTSWAAIVTPEPVKALSVGVKVVVVLVP